MANLVVALQMNTNAAAAVDDDDDDGDDGGGGDDIRPSVMEQLEALRTLKSKEEKTTRRDSVFSRISSYRQKWVSR